MGEGGRFERDPVFNSVPAGRPAFLVWRVKNLALVPLPSAEYGKFHTGDAYVVYSAALPGASGGPGPQARGRAGPLKINIHFWLGDEASVDERTVAAVKTVELDMCLGGSPVQHRETQGQESRAFRAYFPDGIRTMSGGVDSGLRHVTEDFSPALYQVKGKRNVNILQLPSVSWEEMNDGDVFVLETKDVVFVWTGRYSNNVEKLRAAKFATTLKGERGASGSVVILEDGHESSLEGEERDLFEGLLPLRSKRVKSHTQAPKDEIFARQLSSEMKLYQCSDQSGTLKVTEVKAGPLHQADLSSKDAFIVDTGAAGVWVWIGRHASGSERQEAMRNAAGFVAKKGYSDRTRTTRVIDGGEPPEFTSLFKDWVVAGQSKGLPRQTSTNRIAHPVQRPIDAASLHAAPKMAAQVQMVDDGSGQMEMWRIHKFELEPLSESQFGEFYMGDSYVTLYAYTVGAKEHYLIYYWLGVDSSQDEQGTAAARAVELDQKLDGRAVIVRVVQGREPPHFLQLYKGRMVVLEGGYGSGFKTLAQRDEGRKSSYMLQVRGSSARDTRAVEVDFRAGSLNSNDCFVVHTKDETFVWCGRGANGDEREMAKTVLGPKADPTLIMEGREPAHFWAVIGGEEPYASAPGLANPAPADHAPRLFQCSNASGVFQAEEILHFSQEDLVEDDVMLLDTWHTLFLWLGVHCNRVERVNSQQLAVDYLKCDPRARAPDTPIVLIKQGYEPPNFTGFFGVWDNDLWNNNMTYSDICERLQTANPGATVLVSPTQAGEGGVYRRTYPLEVLRIKEIEDLPDDVDPTKKEDYLIEADFERELGVGREAFAALPRWRRDLLKKKAGLY